MDQNAITLTKLFYHKSLLTQILSNNEENVVLKFINLNDAVCLLCNAWGKVSTEVLQKCWHNAHVANNNPDTEYDTEDLIPQNYTWCNTLSLVEEITWFRYAQCSICQY